MNHLLAKLTGIGIRARAGVYALSEEYLAEPDPALTDEDDSLILITGDVFDADGH